jgi:hypothetical protein
MALHMATSYRPQDAQVNEKPTLKSYLDLTLTQHPYDEDSKLQEVHTRLKSIPLELGITTFPRTFAP